jgi:hypothetical protein
MKTVIARHPWLSITAAYVFAISAWIALVALILHRQLS